MLTRSNGLDAGTQPVLGCLVLIAALCLGPQSKAQEAEAPRPVSLGRKTAPRVESAPAEPSGAVARPIRVFPPPEGGSAASSDKVLAAPPVLPLDRTPKEITEPRPKEPPVMDDGIKQLGDVKVLDMREGEGLLRVDGQELRLRPGDRLQTDTVQSVSPERLVLLRPASVDEKKGETLIIIDILGPGRSRVREYTSRDWTSEPPRPVE